MNSSYHNNSIMSLDEDSFNRPKTDNIKRKDNNKKLNSSSSLINRIINSVSKIGQGLKNIMSMKINIENEEDFESNLYNQISNRFNTYEEISLIDAPSFMEESNLKNKKNKNDESNIMMNSQNEINNNIINNKVLDDIENFNNSINNKKEEIINPVLIPNKERKLSIKSTLLNKKRNNPKILENILEEKDEEKKSEKENEEENINNNTNIMAQDKLNNINENKNEKSINSIKMNLSLNKENNNSLRKINKINNISQMSLSNRSIESIKNEISKRREENLRKVEEMQRRHGLNYDQEKEREMREKILNEYYKEKAKRLKEAKLQIEKERQEREEKFKNFRIKKVSGLKYSSTKKKPQILSESKSFEIKYTPVTNNNIPGPKKEVKKQPNTISKEKITFSSNITFGNNSNFGSINEENKFNNNIKDKNDNKSNQKNNEEKETIGQKSLFSFNSNNKNDQIPIKENDMKPNQGLFNNKEQKEQNEQNTNYLFSNDKGNNSNIQKPFDNKKESIFGNMIAKNDETEKKKEEQKIINDTKKDDFFGSSSNNLFNSKDGMNSLFKGDNNLTNNNIFKTQPSNVKDGLFNQNNPISQAMNEQTLFNSNKGDDNAEKSLFNNKKLQNLFGGEKKNDVSSRNSLFGTT